jgi:hypothetical protein
MTTGAPPGASSSSPAATTPAVASASARVSLKLPPAGCFSIQGAPPTTPLVLCHGSKDHWLQQPAGNIPSLAISLAALGLAAWNIWYGWKKDSRVRQQSIDDDYWLRKIVSPMFTEPFVQQGLDLASELPPLAGSSVERVSRLVTMKVKSWQTVMESSRTLSILDKGLAAAIFDDLAKIEESFVSYCGELKAHLHDSKCPKPDRTAAQHLIGEQMYAALAKIKDRQTSLGK